MSKDKVTILCEEPSPLEFIKEENFSDQLIGCEGDESDDQHGVDVDIKKKNGKMQGGLYIKSEEEDCEVNSFDAVSCSLEEEECVLDTDAAYPFVVKKEDGNERPVYFQMKSEEEDAEVKPFEAVFVSKEEDASVSDTDAVDPLSMGTEDEREEEDFKIKNEIENEWFEEAFSARVPR